MQHCRKVALATFTEPTIIQDIFTTGPAHVLAVNNGALRVTFYVDVAPNPVDGEIEHRIVERLILSREAVPLLITMLSDALRAHAYEAILDKRALAKLGH
jgi:hypothetical protein